MLHWRTIFRNIFSNSASYMVTAAAGFVLAPLVVHGLGNTGYGLWTLVLSLTGYFGLLDLGIRSSVGRFVARYLALKDDDNVNRTISTAFAVLSAAGLAALAATAAMIFFFYPSFKIEPQYQDAGRIALFITGLNMACALPLGIFSAVLIALERFDVVSGVTIVGELTRATLVVLLLRGGYGIIALALVAFLVNAGQYCAMGVMVKRLYPGLHPRAGLVDRTTFRDIFGFAVYRFVWAIANQLIFYSSSVIIGIHMSAAAITFFAIAASLINYGRNVVSLVTDTLYPAAARMDAHSDVAGLQRLLAIGTRMALMVAVPLCVGFVFLGRQFITLWMGPVYASSAAFLAVLTIAQFASMAQYTSALILAGMAKHRALAYIALIEAAANITLSIVLVRQFGLMGVAWGMVIPSVICTGIVVPLYTLRQLRLGVWTYVRMAYVRPVVCGVPAALVAYVLGQQVASPGWGVFALEAGAVCLVYAVCAYFFCLDGHQRAYVSGKLSSFMNREPVVHEA